MKRKSHTKLNTITCNDALRHVYDYIDGKLNEKSVAEIIQHLEHCHSCFGRFQFEQLLKNKLSSLKDYKFREKRQKDKHIESILNRFDAL